MGLYMKQPEQPPATVWVVNPVGRVVEVLELAPEVTYAKESDRGWRLASNLEIADAVEKREQKMAEAAEAQAVKMAARAKAAVLRQEAKELVREEAPVKRGPGRPRKVQPVETSEE